MLLVTSKKLNKGKNDISVKQTLCKCLASYRHGCLIRKYIDLLTSKLIYFCIVTRPPCGIVGVIYYLPGGRELATLITYYCNGGTMWTVC